MCFADILLWKRKKIESYRLLFKNELIAFYLFILKATANCYALSKFDLFQKSMRGANASGASLFDERLLCFYWPLILTSNIIYFVTCIYAKCGPETWIFQTNKGNNRLKKSEKWFISILNKSKRKTKWSISNFKPSRTNQNSNIFTIWIFIQFSD